MHARQDYHGCLVIGVTRSAELYQRIAGWAAGTMQSKDIVC
jgi:hypothetical protein